VAAIVLLLLLCNNGSQEMLGISCHAKILPAGKICKTLTSLAENLGHQKPIIVFDCRKMFQKIFGHQNAMHSDCRIGF
jgi:hypothetical protein